jgi:excisionase family DNA binding protein
MEVGALRRPVRADRDTPPRLEASGMRDSFDPEVLSPHQVAELTGQHYKTILRHIKSGKLRAVQWVDKGNLRIHIEDYDAYIKGVKPRVAMPERHITARTA